MTPLIVLDGPAARARCTWCGSPFHHACGAHDAAHRPHRFHARAHAGLVVALAVLAVFAAIEVVR